jgi:hypothetical protein
VIRFSWTIAGYYFQTRQLVWALPVTIAVTLVGALHAWTQNSSMSRMPGVVVPGLVAGIVLASLMVSPFAELDDPHQDSLRPLRLATLIIGLLLVAAIFQILGRTLYSFDNVEQIMSRAMLGTCGLTLAGIGTLGRTRAWVPPMIWGTGAIVSRGSNGEYPWWAWQVQGGGNLWSWVIAIIMMAVGLFALWNMPFLKGH